MKLLVFISLLILACNQEPYKPDFSLVAGYVIGKENCNKDESKDYWLINLTYLPNTPQYGDTLILNGTTYTNVVKTKGLSNRVKEIGKKVTIEYKTITTNKVQTIECDISNPATYNLKEIFVIDLGEIR